MFFAFWSGPCQAMAPTVHAVQSEYEARVNFIYLDIDDPANERWKQSIGFRSEPQFFLLDAQGRILRQWSGYVTAETLRQALDTALR